MAASFFSSSLGSLSNDDDDGNENDKKVITKQQHCTCITLFCTFLWRCCTTTTCKCLNSRFVRGREHKTTIFFFSSWTLMIQKSPLEFNSKKFSNVWRSVKSLFKWRFRSRRRRCSLSFLLLLVKTYALKSPESCSFPCSQDMRQLNNLLCYKQD